MPTDPGEPAQIEKDTAYENIRTLAHEIVKQETATTRGAKFWAFLNSAFTIWLLTAVFGTLVAYTYTNLQTCLKDAEEKAVRYSNLKLEIRNRTATAVDAVMQAPNAAALKASFASLPYTRAEFKDINLVSLNFDLRELRSRFVRANQQREVEIIELQKKYPPNWPELEFIAVLGGTLRLNFSDADLSRMKTAIPRLAEYLHDSFRLEDNWVLTSECTVCTALMSLFRSRGPVLEQRRVIHLQSLSP